MKIPWCRAWWHMSVISALGRLRQKKDLSFKATVDYIGRNLSYKNKQAYSLSSFTIMILGIYLNLFY